MIVKKKPGAYYRLTAHPGDLRKDEAHRMNDVGRFREQHFSFGERFTNEPELKMLEVSEAAVDEFGACRRCGPREVVRFSEEDREPAHCRIGRDPGAVDAPADYQEIVNLVRHASMPP